MSRNVRNWWLVADIDGRKTRITGGPKEADGGFSLTVYQRDAGRIFSACRLRGTVKDGILTLVANGPKNEVVIARTSRW